MLCLIFFPDKWAIPFSRNLYLPTSITITASTSRWTSLEHVNVYSNIICLLTLLSITHTPTQTTTNTHTSNPHKHTPTQTHTQTQTHSHSNSQKHAFTLSKSRQRKENEFDRHSQPTIMHLTTWYSKSNQ